MRFSTKSRNHSTPVHFAFTLFIIAIVNLRHESTAIAKVLVAENCANNYVLYLKKWRDSNTQQVIFNKNDNVSFKMKIAPKDDIAMMQMDTMNNIPQDIAIYLKDTYNVNVFPYIDHDLGDSSSWLNISNFFAIAESSIFKTLCVHQDASACESIKPQEDFTTQRNVHLCSTAPDRIVALTITSDNQNALLHKTIVINHQEVNLTTIPFLYKSTQQNFVISAELSETAIIIPTYVSCGESSATDCIWKPTITTYDEYNASSILPPSTFYIFGAQHLLVATLRVNYAEGKITTKTLVTDGHAAYSKKHGAYVTIKMRDHRDREVFTYDITGVEMPIEEKHHDFQTGHVLSFVAKEPLRIKIGNYLWPQWSNGEFKITSKGLRILPTSIFYIYGQREYIIGSLYVDYAKLQVLVQIQYETGHSGYPRKSGPYLTITMHDSSRRQTHSYQIYGTEMPIEEKKFDFKLGHVIIFDAKELQAVKLGGQSLSEVGSNEVEITPNGLKISSTFHILGIGDALIAVLNVNHASRKILLNTLVTEGHSYFPKNKGPYVTIKIYDWSRREKHSYDIYGTGMPIEQKHFDFQTDDIISFVAKEPTRVKLGDQNLLDFGSNDFQIGSNGLRSYFRILGIGDVPIAWLYVDYVDQKIVVKTLATDGHPYYPKSTGSPYVAIKIYDSQRREKHSYNIYGNGMSIEEKKFDFQSDYILSFTAKESLRVKYGDRSLQDVGSNEVKLKSKTFRIKQTDSNALIKQNRNVLSNDLQRRPSLRKYLYFKWLMDHLQDLPYLTTAPHGVTWKENQGPGVITELLATYEDGPRDGTTFTIELNPNHPQVSQIRSKFQVKDSKLYATKPFDREEQNEYHVPLKITDNGNPSQSVARELRVEILDVNDNPPKFVKDQFEAEISQKTAINECIIQVKATDKDSNSSITYTIVGGNSNETFLIKPTTGEIRMKNPPNHKIVSQFILRVRAFDGLFDHEAHVIIKLVKPPDDAPVFVVYTKEMTIREELPAGRLFQVKARDPRLGTNDASQNIIYSIADEQQRQFFSIDKDGYVNLIKPLDREYENSNEKWHLLISASNQGTPTEKKVTSNSTISVTIKLIDINDNAPYLDMKVPHVTWKTNRSPGLVTKLIAADKDGPRNGPPFKFELNPYADINSYKRFQIRNSELHAIVVFDNHSPKEYDIPIKITDSGTPPKSAYSKLKVIIDR